MKKVIKALLTPVEYCWKATEVASRNWPCPKTIHVLVTALSSLVAYSLALFLIVALIRGIVAFF